MESVEERVAYLEGRMEDYTVLIADIRTGMRGLRSDMRAEMSELRQRLDRHFTWLVGVLVGVLLALVGLALQVARLQPV